MAVPYANAAGRDAQRLHPRRAQFWLAETEVYQAEAEAALSADERRHSLVKAREAADWLVDEIHPTRVGYRLLRAEVLEALGDHDGARRDYQAALTYDEKQRDPLLRLPPAERQAIGAALRRLTS